MAPLNVIKRKGYQKIKLTEDQKAFCDDMAEKLLDISLCASAGCAYELAAKFHSLHDAFATASKVTEKNMAVKKAVDML